MTSRMALILALGGSSAAGRTEPRTWVTAGFEAFARRTFDAAGNNRCVWRCGGVRRARAWDINGDGVKELDALNQGRKQFDLEGGCVSMH